MGVASTGGGNPTDHYILSKRIEMAAEKVRQGDIEEGNLSVLIKHVKTQFAGTLAKGAGQRAVEFVSTLM